MNIPRFICSVDFLTSFSLPLPTHYLPASVGSWLRRRRSGCGSAAPVCPYSLFGLWLWADSALPKELLPGHRLRGL